MFIGSSVVENKFKYNDIVRIQSQYKGRYTKGSISYGIIKSPSLDSKFCRRYIVEYVLPESLRALGDRFVDEEDITLADKEEQVLVLMSR